MFARVCRINSGVRSQSRQAWLWLPSLPQVVCIAGWPLQKTAELNSASVKWKNLKYLRRIRNARLWLLTCTAGSGNRCHPSPTRNVKLSSRSLSKKCLCYRLKSLFDRFPMATRYRLNIDSNSQTLSGLSVLSHPLEGCTTYACITCNRPPTASNSYSCR